MLPFVGRHRDKNIALISITKYVQPQAMFVTHILCVYFIMHGSIVVVTFPLPRNPWDKVSPSDPGWGIFETVLSWG